MKYCYRCGRSIGDDFEFCPFCGTTAGDLYILRPDVPVFVAEPVKEPPLGGRIMAGLSKGLGIAALVFSIIATSLVLSMYSDILSGVRPDVGSAPVVFLLFTSMFAVPALLLSIFAGKQGVRAAAGKVFGIIGCAVSGLLLLGLLPL